MPKRAISVEQFMHALDHPLKAEIEAVQAIILGTNDPAGEQGGEQIVEQIKWNAPTFGYGGEDRITFRLHPPTHLQLIFHRGAKPCADIATFAFADASGLLKWVAQDRATLTLRDMDDVQTHAAALADLAQRWMQATRD